MSCPPPSSGHQGQPTAITCQDGVQRFFFYHDHLPVNIPRRETGSSLLSNLSKRLDVCRGADPSSGLCAHPVLASERSSGHTWLLLPVSHFTFPHKAIADGSAAELWGLWICYIMIHTNFGRSMAALWQLRSHSDEPPLRMLAHCVLTCSLLL